MPRVVDGLSSGLEFEAPDLNINSDWHSNLQPGRSPKL
jgi:hypothetical protein